MAGMQTNSSTLVLKMINQLHGGFQQNNQWMKYESQFKTWTRKLAMWKRNSGRKWIWGRGELSVWNEKFNKSNKNIVESLTNRLNQEGKDYQELKTKLAK
jgi:hypothetical protein